jgi:hypothetical protein
MTEEVDNDDQLIRQYLLGGLTPAQREQVERRVFTDSRYRERVELAEAELIDEYADGALAEDEYRAFAGRYLATPHLRLGVRVVEELQRRAARGAAAGAEQVAAAAEPPPSRPDPRRRWGWLAALRRHRTPVLVTGLALIVVAAAALLFRPGGGPRPLEERLLHERSPRADLEREVARLSAPRDETEERAAREAQASALASLELAPGIQRDVPEGVAYPSIDVPEGGGYARLRLRLDPAADRYQSFRASFKTVDSSEEFEADLSASADGRGRYLDVMLPLLKLPGGDYQIQLHGRDAPGRLQELPRHYYHLRITRRRQ